MKIINIDDFFSNLTVDSTNVSVDNDEITVDTIHYYDDVCRLQIIPRENVTYNLSVKIVDKFNYIEQDFATYGLTRKGLLNINLSGFNPDFDTKYEITVFNENGVVIWYGQAMATEKNIQNYQLNNSDENNLKV